MPSDPEQQRILITQAMPGMVLAQPVKDPAGVALCGAGATLSDALIQRLTMRGIKRIHVAGNPLPAPSQKPLEERLQELRHRFSKVGHVPLMAIVERAIEAQVVKHS